MKAQTSGKVKVTKKALDQPTTHKITEVQAKQLLQALRAVQADDSFRLLGIDTTTLVVAALDEFDPDLIYAARSK